MANLYALIGESPIGEKMENNGKDMCCSTQEGEVKNKFLSRAEADKLPGGKLVIPEWHRTFEVYSVPTDNPNVFAVRGVFSGRDDLIEVIIPKGVTELSDDMFLDCRLHQPAGAGDTRFR